MQRSVHGQARPQAQRLRPVAVAPNPHANLAQFDPAADAATRALLAHRHVDEATTIGQALHQLRDEVAPGAQHEVTVHRRTCGQRLLGKRGAPTQPSRQQQRTRRQLYQQPQAHCPFGFAMPPSGRCDRVVQADSQQHARRQLREGGAPAPTASLAHRRADLGSACESELSAVDPDRPPTALLDDEAVLEPIVAALDARWAQSRRRGRPGTPAEVVLRMPCSSSTCTAGAMTPLSARCA